MTIADNVVRALEAAIARVRSDTSLAQEPNRLHSPEAIEAAAISVAALAVCHANKRDPREIAKHLLVAPKVMDFMEDLAKKMGLDTGEMEHAALISKMAHDRFNFNESEGTIISGEHVPAAVTFTATTIIGHGREAAAHLSKYLEEAVECQQDEDLPEDPNSTAIRKATAAVLIEAILAITAVPIEPVLANVLREARERD